MKAAREAGLVLMQKEGPARRGRSQREGRLRRAQPDSRGVLQKEVRAGWRRWGAWSEQLSCGVILVEERTMAEDV